MANRPHIRPLRASSAIQGRFALQSRLVPSELYLAYIATESVDVNQQFWLKRGDAAVPVKAKVESIEFLDLPQSVADAAHAIDAARGHQELRLFTGNSPNALTEVLQDDSTNRRYSVMLSLG